MSVLDPQKLYGTYLLSLKCPRIPPTLINIPSQTNKSTSLEIICYTLKYSALDANITCIEITFIHKEQNVLCRLHHQETILKC